MDNCSLPYSIDFSPLYGVEKPSKIVLQLPDGLKQYAVCIAREIEKITKAKVYIDGDSSFGSCDLHWPRLAFLLQADMVIHVGHTPYPKELASEKVEPSPSVLRVVYLPARSKLPIPGQVVEKAVKLLKSRGAEKVVVTATAQHTHIVKEIGEMLAKHNINPIIPPPQPPYFEEGQVIGCDYRLARRYDADAYVMVSGGTFHSLGLYLSTLKPVVQIDPYRREVFDRTSDFERIYSLRLYKVSEAMNAKNWGIIVGLKSGQYRPWLVGFILKLIEEKGGESFVYVSETLSEYTLRTIDTAGIDAWVITSCPRLPIDDFQRYEKPVLTPGEAKMALQGRLEPYIFPW